MQDNVYKIKFIIDRTHIILGLTKTFMVVCDLVSQN